MRKIIALATVGVMALSLGACATDPTTGMPTINQQELANVEAQVQQTAANVCSFVPTVASVAGIIASFVAAGAVVNLVDQAAQQICNAISQAPTTTTKSGKKMLAATASVNGVAIQGYFISK